MKKIKNRRKLNNQGMSLIEILVAIMILAIVSGPLLHALATSISMNTRAKERQRVITIAQSIMEGLKAYDMEQICRQFNGGSMHLVANGASWYEIPVSDHNGDGEINVYDVSIDASGVFHPASDGRYEFALTDVKYEGINRDEYYDARIEISPNTLWNPSLSAYGTTEMPDVVNMNEYLDAVYRQDSVSMDQTVYSLIMQNLLEELNDKNKSGDVFDLHDLETMGTLKVNRVITVAVNEGGDESVNIVTVKIEYIYEATGYTYTDEAGHTQSLVFSGIEEPSAYSPKTVYDNTQTAALGAQLENVYIYYYPAYELNGMNITSDKIVLQNNTASMKNIYLVKQVNSSLSHANLMNYEYSYRVGVEGSGPITLYHNLDENLGNPGSPMGTPSISGVTLGGGMLADTQEVLLYNVKVSLYSAGAAGNDFPEEDLLLELNGSINN